MILIQSNLAKKIANSFFDYVKLIAKNFSPTSFSSLNLPLNTNSPTASRQIFLPKYYAKSAIEKLISKLSTPKHRSNLTRALILGSLSGSNLLPESISKAQKELRSDPKIGFPQVLSRQFSTSDDNEKEIPLKLFHDNHKPFPRLTNFEFLGVDTASPIYGFTLAKMFLQVFTQVRPNIDSRFNLQAFSDGSLHAFLSISNKIAELDVESLTNLVTRDALDQIKDKMGELSDKHRECLTVDTKNVNTFGPHKIELITKSDDRKLLEIIVVYTYTIDAPNPEPDTSFFPNKDVIISHFKFVREYLNGELGEWYCSGLNYYYMEHLLRLKLERAKA